MNGFRLRSGDAHLAVSVEGDAGKPWLLLSNSLGADMRMWDGQIGLLIRTHRVLRYDTRGHGDSDAPPGPYSFGMLVADMVAILEHFDVGQADVMGLSLGGMTALGLALEHPQRVGHMVVCDARADAPAPFVASWDQRIAAIEEGGMEAIVAGTLERWFTPSCPKEIVEKAAGMIRKTAPEGYIGCAHALKELDYLKHLARLRAPVLYVVGSEDMGAPREAMAEMAERTPRAELAVLQGLAHIPNMEDGDAFAAAVGPFWQAREVEREH